MTAIIEVKALRKAYPKLTAVDGVDFAIAEGICFGLLGPNGAGKSTTIEMIEGLKKASSGEILFRGQPMNSDFKKVAGIQFQSTALQDYLSVADNLTLFRSFYDRHTDLQELILDCDLSDFLQQDASKLSGGQRQRLLLALALVHDPEVIFLDEPTTGLDPQARRQFWSLIQKIKARNKTIILTTHYMEEAYLLCDEIAIMAKGKLIAQGTPDALLAQHFGDNILELPTEVLGDFTPPETHFKNSDKTEIFTRTMNQTLQSLMSAGIDLTHLKIRSRTLDDLFLELTAKDSTGLKSAKGAANV
ncbi:ABC transporter ATP-binding protein [Thiosulfativibrio zosterae]|uniref:ABC transporter ATP-binding protein n=1 Tax=Thiosulfativibrio zosterae TaxID=2675053 RepID=A0A6F8PQ70_9GAMM|nr:ABC transporter ATP-binding protein [Thiosulfativibrio zosterae]BBP44184.1 ABC transporter ATP-binding protein [Thiosulfativibrio zosterae]